MGREVRRVPKDWEHPMRENGRYIPLLSGYAKDAVEFLKIANTEGLQEAVEYFGCCPNKENYMPEWSSDEAQYYMMYENTSEGTPISPAFKTAEKLARWLTKNDVSSFADQTATYESWLRVANGGYACSAIVRNGVIENGVDALTKPE